MLSQNREPSKVSLYDPYEANDNRLIDYERNGLTFKHIKEVGSQERLLRERQQYEEVSRNISSQALRESSEVIQQSSMESLNKVKREPPQPWSMSKRESRMHGIRDRLMYGISGDPDREVPS